MDLSYLILFIVLAIPFKSLGIEDWDESDLLHVCADERVLKQLKKEALLVSELSADLDEKDHYLPLKVDWREKGAISTVKHQRQCGSCWAFSAIGAVEGIHKIQSHKLLNLSAQQLVDCDKGNRGCESGNIGPAFEYITKHGIATQDDYPYTGKAAHCNTHVSTHRFIGGFSYVPATERHLMAAVARQPIAAYIATDVKAFSEHKGSIFKGPCGTELNHAILVVGYGTTPEGKKYWIVKNSWGRKWGDGGFMLMERDIGEKGICGIASLASYPIPVQD